MFINFDKEFSKIHERQTIVFLLICILAATASIIFIFYISEKLEKEISEIYLAQVSSSINFENRDRATTLMFVGDIMLDRGVEWMVNKYGNGDWKFPFSKIVGTLREADISFGNLEGPISDKGQRVGSIYSFRADPKAIEGLTYAGFDVLSVANNHLFDYGIKALEDMLLRLKTAEIDYVGAGFDEEEAYAPVIREVNRVKIAFMAYTELGSESWQAKNNNSGIAWLTEERLEKDVKEAKKQADIVVVSFHFGNEYNNYSNKEQRLFAHLAIDSGADLVVGHHPHVVQETEEYKDGFIAYSLGNFVFDQKFSKETMEGLLLKVLIENKKIKEITPVDIKINDFFQPEIAD